MNEPKPASAFDFQELIASTLVDYLPRPSIEEEILNCLDGGHNCCVITGEPGSGKTVLAAALIDAKGYLRHFLRRGHTEFSLWRDPYAFLTAFGFQLKERFGDALFPETVRIDAQGHVRNLEEAGSYAITDIQQLVAVPWHTTTLNVNLKAEKIRGTATGVRIQQLVEDYRRVPLSTFREMALVEPLRRLRRLRPEERVILWVDGLDEELELLSDNTINTQGIADVLPLPAELDELGNLQLVISSRSSPLLDRFLEGGAVSVDLGDARFEKDNEALIGRYIDREFSKDSVRSRIIEAGKQFEEVRKEVVDACDNNLLYLRHFFIALKDGELADLLTGGLPKSLGSIYIRLLNQIVKRAQDEYIANYNPIMSALAVSARALSAEQIVQFSGLERGQVNAVMTAIRPFLDVDRIESSNVYGFYHRSFGETLLSDANQDKIWYVDPKAANSRLAQFYVDRWETDQNLDDYGLNFLIYHLARSKPDLQGYIFSLISESWRQVKRAYFRSNMSFSTDLAVAAQLAQSLPFPDRLLKTTTLALMETMVTDVSMKIPEGALRLMVCLGQLQRAFDYIKLDLNPVMLIQLFADLLRGLIANDNVGKALLYQTIQQSLEVCGAHPDQSHGLLSMTLEVCPPDKDNRMDELLQYAIEIFNSSERPYWETPRALIELARLQTVLNRDEAERTFRQALESIPQYAGPSKGLLLSKLFKYWAEFDPDLAAKALEQQPLTSDVGSFEATLSVARAAAQSGNDAALSYIHTFAIQNFAPLITDPFDKAIALIMLAGLELDLDDQPSAAETMRQAFSVIQQIGGADDPERESKTRLPQATTAMIFAAEMDLQVDPGHCQESLRQAWSSLREHGYWEAGDTLGKLVRTQFQLNRDLLEMQIENVSDFEIKSNLLVVAAMAALNADDTSAAADMLEASLELQEQPRDRSPGYSELCLHIAEASILDDLDYAQELIKNSYQFDGVVITWRLNVLRRLVQNNDPVAFEWLWDTVAKWDQPHFNPNYVCKFPGIVKDLPDDLTQRLAESIERIVCPTQKRLMASALAARLKRTDPKFDTLYSIAFGPMDSEELIIPPRKILAFAAGQWWYSDRKLAERLLQDALLQLETDEYFADNSSSLDIHLMHTLEALLIGAPEAALPILLAYKAPPPAPNQMFFRLPGPGVPPYLGAGIRDRDYLLALALGQEACHTGSIRDHIAALTNQIVRGIASATAARLAQDAPLDLRLAWCKAAQDAANQLAEHYLQCLLFADSAEAFLEVGAKRKAVELARTTAKSIIEQGGYYESIYRQPAYTHALGKCIQVEANALGADDAPETARTLWEARCVGIGLHTVLGYIVPIVAKAGINALKDLLGAEMKGTSLFS